MSAATSAPRVVVEAYLKARAARDADAVAACLAEDATWSFPGRDLPLSGIWRGRDAILNDLLGAARVLFAPDGAPESTVGNLVAEGEQVVLEWTARGTAANGRPYDNRCIGVFTVRDGRITSVREYADTLHVAQTLFAE